MSNGMAYIAAHSLAMLKSYPILFLCAVALSLSSCAGTIALHDFSYHGTDAVLADNDFFYIAQGVVGKSTTEYNLHGESGGFVKDGLVADAKNDLAEQSPLGPNQTYANMAIDVITENIGFWWGGTHFVKRIRLSAVVSADIVEFGEPRLSNSVPRQSSGTLPESSTEPVGNRTVSADKSLTDSSADPLQQRSFEIGDSVWFEYRGKAAFGYVEEMRGDRVKIRFTFQGSDKFNVSSVFEIYRTEAEVFED